MKCLFIDGVKKVSLQEREVSEIGPRDVLVKLEARGICGTDLSSYRSGFAMGFGHEMAGVVYKVGCESDFVVGTKVFISNLSQNLVSYAPESGYAYMGGFADYILVKNAVVDVDLYPVPESMSFSQIALIEPFCVSMSGVKKYPVNKDSKVVIFGAGIIGMCAFEYLKSQGVQNTVVVDINESRLLRAKKAGAIPFNSKEGNLKDFLSEIYGINYSMLVGPVPDVDVYIDAAGVGSLLNEALNMIKIGGQITILAVYHKAPEINMTSVMYNSVKINGSCMFTPQDILEAIEIFQKNPCIAQHIISHEIPFEEAQRGFEIADNPSECLKVMLVG